MWNNKTKTMWTKAAHGFPKSKVRRESYVVGDTIHVFMFTDEDEAEVRAKVEALVVPNGLARVATKDGTRVWVEDRPLFDSTKTGADCYTWDKTGDKVKCERVRVTIRRKDGVPQERTEVVEKRLYRDFMAVT